MNKNKTTTPEKIEDKTGRAITTSNLIPNKRAFTKEDLKNWISFLAPKKSPEKIIDNNKKKSYNKT